MIHEERNLPHNLLAVINVAIAGSPRAMKDPGKMKKEALVFFAEQVQLLLYLKDDDTWDPARKWGKGTLVDLKDIMQRFDLVPEKPRPPGRKP